jgi:hypothetical protein
MIDQCPCRCGLIGSMGGGNFKSMISHFFLSHFVYLCFLWRGKCDFIVFFAIFPENCLSPITWYQSLSRGRPRTKMVPALRGENFRRRRPPVGWQICMFFKVETFNTSLQNFEGAIFWCQIRAPRIQPCIRVFFFRISVFLASYFPNMNVVWKDGAFKVLRDCWRKQIDLATSSSLKTRICKHSEIIYFWLCIFDSAHAIYLYPPGISIFAVQNVAHLS